MRATALALLAAAIFHLWDGKALPATGWVAHGDEYVLTLEDGAVLILRQREVREIVPGEQPADETRGSAKASEPQTER